MAQSAMVGRLIRVHRFVHPEQPLTVRVTVSQVAYRTKSATPCDDHQNREMGPLIAGHRQITAEERRLGEHPSQV